MGRRAIGNKNSKKTINKETLSEDVITISDKENEKIKKSIDEKLDKVWRDKNCYIEIKNNEIPVFRIFLNLLKDISIGKFSEDSAKMLEMISYTDRFEKDITHKIEKCKLDQINDLVYNTKEQYFLLNRRRELKDLYDNRLVMMKIATALKDVIREDLINECIKSLDDLEEFRKQPKYCPVVDYEMSEKYDWAYEQNPDKPLYKNSNKFQNAGAHMYKVYCDVIGYKRSQKPTEFSRRVYTINEQMAIDEWKGYVAKLNGVSYKDSDIKVEIIC